MTQFLMTAWDGAGAMPPLMSVAQALVGRGHSVRVLADPVLRSEVEATGAEHLNWTRAPHRATTDRESHFVRDWEPGPEGLARMRDNLAVGPAAAFAEDVREELTQRHTDCLLTEVLLFEPARLPRRRQRCRMWSSIRRSTWCRRRTCPHSGRVSCPRSQTPTGSAIGSLRSAACRPGTRHSRR